MSALWAITCFFNPAGYRRRLQNYKWFREHLTIPLVTVELSFTGEYALRNGDAEILVQLDQGDVLFQKERLLNIALQHLPATCEAVAWIDCDVIFPAKDWSSQTMEALQRFAVVQPFSERFDLLPDSHPRDIAGWDRPRDRLSLMAKIAQDGLTAADFQEQKPSLGNPAWGLVWAARKHVLDRHGLYDGCVLTSGDIAIFCAALGAMEGAFMRNRMNASSFEHYSSWAKPFDETVRGRVGHVEGRLFHLWHGSIENRRYGKCHHELKDLGFDPFTDIAKTEQDTWRWSSDKPELHAHVQEYFFSRKEDEVEASAG